MDNLAFRRESEQQNLLLRAGWTPPGGINCDIKIEKWVQDRFAEWGWKPPVASPPRPKQLFKAPPAMALPPAFEAKPKARPPGYKAPPVGFQRPAQAPQPCFELSSKARALCKAPPPGAGWNPNFVGNPHFVAAFGLPPPSIDSIETQDEDELAQQGAGVVKICRREVSVAAPTPARQPPSTRRRTSRSKHRFALLTNVKKNRHKPTVFSRDLLILPGFDVGYLLILHGCTGIMMFAFVLFCLAWL